MDQTTKHRSGAQKASPDARTASPLEVILVLVVVAAVVAMAIWFVCVSSGGIGPGTV